MDRRYSCHNELFGISTAILSRIEFMILKKKKVALEKRASRERETILLITWQQPDGKVSFDYSSFISFPSLSFLHSLHPTGQQFLPPSLPTSLAATHHYGSGRVGRVAGIRASPSQLSPLSAPLPSLHHNTAINHSGAHLSHY